MKTLPLRLDSLSFFLKWLQVIQLYSATSPFSAIIFSLIFLLHLHCPVAISRLTSLVEDLHQVEAAEVAGPGQYLT